ncbi:MAG: cytochrome c [Betaproteobacteria bacterium]|nr:MAG: cytochrome c [Betaproteobacteria bacterium]
MTKTQPTKHKAVAFFLSVLAAFAFPTVVAMTAPVAHAEEDDGRPKIVVPRRGGREIFSEHCVLCHKYDGRGGPSEGGWGADLRQTALTRDQLIVIITYGREPKGMPPFKDLLEAEKIETLATFILDDLRLPELKNN